MNGDLAARRAVLAAARADATASLRAAEQRRDAEQRKLRDEHITVVQPLKRLIDVNHFADWIAGHVGGEGQP